MLRSVHRALALGVLLLATREASATFHFIDINEVYTNADGTIQFIELIADFAGQTDLSLARLVARGPDGTPVTIILNVTTNFPALDNGETVLFATAGFQAVAGFPPDYIIPDGLIPFPSGQVTWENDAGTSIVDRIAYGTYAGTLPVGTAPAQPLPCNGRQSLTRVDATSNNSAVAFALRAPSPTRNDTTTLQLSLPPGIDCNTNDSPDLCDIAKGTSLDENGDDIPDECDIAHSPADFDVDGDVDLDDYLAIHDCIDGPDGGIMPDCDNKDFNGDETVDLIDIAPFLGEFTGTP
jgi:hypothetical protein